MAVDYPRKYRETMTEMIRFEFRHLERLIVQLILEHSLGCGRPSVRLDSGNEFAKLVQMHAGRFHAALRRLRKARVVLVEGNEYSVRTDCTQWDIEESFSRRVWDFACATLTFYNGCSQGEPLSWQQSLDRALVRANLESGETLGLGIARSDGIGHAHGQAVESPGAILASDANKNNFVPKAPDADLVTYDFPDSIEKVWPLAQSDHSSTSGTIHVPLELANKVREAVEKACRGESFDDSGGDVNSPCPAIVTSAIAGPSSVPKFGTAKTESKPQMETVPKTGTATQSKSQPPARTVPKFGTPESNCAENRHTSEPNCAEIRHGSGANCAEFRHDFPPTVPKTGTIFSETGSEGANCAENRHGAVPKTGTAGGGRGGNRLIDYSVPILKDRLIDFRIGTVMYSGTPRSRELMERFTEICPDENMNDWGVDLFTNFVCRDPDLFEEELGQLKAIVMEKRCDRNGNPIGSYARYFRKMLLRRFPPKTPVQSKG